MEQVIKLLEKALMKSEELEKKELPKELKQSIEILKNHLQLEKRLEEEKEKKESLQRQLDMERRIHEDTKYMTPSEERAYYDSWAGFG